MLCCARVRAAANASEALLERLQAWLPAKKLPHDSTLVHSVIVETARKAIVRAFRDKAHLLLLPVFVEPLSHAVFARFQAIDAAAEGPADADARVAVNVV